MIKDKELKANRKRELAENIAKVWFLINALVAIVSVVAIAFFVFYKGLQPFMPSNEYGTYNILDFIFGLEWRPGKNLFGIAFMIIGSIFATIGAIIIGVPIAILTAVFISEVANEKIRKIVKPAVELLAGIPSVLYGVFGLGVIVPYINSLSDKYPQGESLLAVIIVLAIMILPTVITITENAINSVPNSYREGSYALGVSKIQTIFKVVLPSAKSGILTGVVLGVGRAIGETMAVILVAGNPISGIPTDIFQPIRPLTTNIALEMSYAAELHQQMLFATGVVLFVFIIGINLLLSKLTSKIDSSKE